jgi:ATP-dependent Lon protease
VEELDIYRKIIDTPLMFRVLKLDITIDAKNSILTKVNDKDFSRLIGRLEAIPFMNRYNVWMTRTEMITRLRTVLNTAVTGHEAAKRKIIRHISLPNHFGRGKSIIIGLHGPYGMGQAAIVNALSEAMNMERVRIDLRGCSEKGYLNGRCDNDMSPGEVASGMIQTKHMNPIFQFDNVDTIVGTAHGAELESVILQMTDDTTACRFRDKYIGDIDLDISGSIIVFTYTNRERVHPALLDRMVEVDIEKYDFKQKMEIIYTHLLPTSIEKYKLPNELVQSLYRKDFVAACIRYGSEGEGLSEVQKLIDTVCAEIDLLCVMQESVPDGLELLDDMKLVNAYTTMNMMYN